MTPPGLTRIQLFSGGAEAVEAAFRLAKSVTRKFEFVGYSGAFHGKTGGVLPLLWGDFKDGLGPFVPGTYVAPYAYCYRCPLNLTYPGCGIACAEETRGVIKNQTRRPDRRDHRRADAGHRRQRHPAAGIPARGAQRSRRSTARSSSPTR